MHLTDAEKSKDEAGNVIEFETRGERVVHGIFFLVKDVSLKLIGHADAVRKIVLDSAKTT